MNEDEQSERTGATDDAGTSDEAAGTGGESAHPAESVASSQSEAGSSADTVVTGPSENPAVSSPAASEAAGAAAGSRPWYSRPPARARIIAVPLAGLAYALMFFRGLQDIVAPVFLALNFYIVVYPVQRALTRLKVPRAIGACLSVVLVLC